MSNLNSILIKLILPALLRSVLIAAGGYVTAKGYVDNDTFNTIAGVIMGLVGGTWSVAQKIGVAKKESVLNDVAATHPQAVSSAAVANNVKPSSVGVTYPNNPPR